MKTLVVRTNFNGLLVGKGGVDINNIGTKILIVLFIPCQSVDSLWLRQKMWPAQKANQSTGFLPA